jgi:hypothetical protein
MTRYDEARVAALLGLLRPAPHAWVEAAQELPRARRTLDDLVRRAEADAAVRARVVADLVEALRLEGIEPRPRLVADLRRLLDT